MSLTDSLLDWRDFYSATSNVSAALVGLVFVAISIHLGRHPLENRDRVLGEMTIVNLLHPLFAALGMLLPISQVAKGVGLLVLASACLAGTIAIDVSEAREQRHEGRFTFAYRFLIPLVAALFLAGTSIGLMFGWRLAVYGPPVFVFLMLIVGTQNAWDLLLGSRKVGTSIPR